MNKPSQRVVRCPACGGDSVFDSSNRWRPFCSERCKQHDFGAWASERYAMPEQEGQSDPDFEQS
ncbi:MAG: DNA gyrase inhibitor YacG [Hydrogenophaga sp.]|uniref:DNA gyrase inhibitor YacG n=1 Tax=Hydrogenophaga sp. TaxID=1904254 RepID=UPI001DB529DC|nr:DNA gyrase inhibitor YacG [Hydrogenophaga sp.]MBX3611714.1 DNA gyrase inhibitor YacG [Hydrogenophaga sp.]